MQALLLLLLAMPTIYAIRCYSYVSTDANKDPMKTWVECPFETQYCYKSYAEQTALSTNLSTRSCGTANLCAREGCSGSDADKTCCCRGELCNSSRNTATITVLTALAALFTMKFF